MDECNVSKIASRFLHLSFFFVLYENKSEISNFGTTYVNAKRNQKGINGTARDGAIFPYLIRA